MFDALVAFFLPLLPFICYKEVLASASLLSVYILITVIITVRYLIVTFHLFPIPPAQIILIVIGKSWHWDILTRD